MSDESLVLFERRGAVAVLTLNRPTVGNAIDVPMARALMEAAIACDEDESIRCVLLTGNGRLFCAGGDVGGFAKAGDNAAALVKEITAYLHVAISRLSRMCKPLVCALNGPAAGAGFSLAVLGDLVLAAKSAHLTLAYTAIGLTPDGGSTWLLPRLVGLRLSQELVLTNRRVGAEEAATLGLITRAVDDADLAAEADKLAMTLAAGATQALGQARRLLLSSFDSSLETQMEMESRSIGDATRTPHGKEGISAFLGKRKPEFK
ncbi:MAG: enoyl-CoA hydratase-related protein [Pseudomonadota bacterium]